MSELNTGIFTADNAREYLEREPEMLIDRVSERMWTISDGVRRTLFLEGNNSIVAFDTFGTPGAAHAYRKAVEATITGKSIATVIYTHDHLDHAGFADDFAPDAEIIADEMCAKVVRLRQSRGQRVPTRELSGTRHEMEIDGLQFTLLNPGPTHGTWNLSAHFAEENLLFSSARLT